jgi:hypothetical protein
MLVKHFNQHSMQIINKIKANKINLVVLKQQNFHIINIKIS